MPCWFWCLICFGHHRHTSKVFRSILTLGIIQWGRNTSGKCARAHKTPAFWAYLHLHVLRWALPWFGTWVYSSYSMSQYDTKALTSPSMQFLQSCWGRTCRCMLMLSNFVSQFEATKHQLFYPNRGNPWTVPVRPHESEDRGGEKGHQTVPKKQHVWHVWLVKQVAALDLFRPWNFSLHRVVLWSGLDSRNCILINVWQNVT